MTKKQKKVMWRIIVSAAMLVISFAELVNLDIQIAFYIAAIIFHFAFLGAIGRLASSLKLRNIASKCICYGIFILIEIGVIIAATVFWYLKMTVAKYLLMAAVILPYVIFVLDLVLIYSCYKNICEEGCEDLPRKPSKIPFINKLLDARDKREEERRSLVKGCAFYAVDFGQKKRPSSKTKGGAGVDLRCQMRFLKQIMRFAS